MRVIELSLDVYIVAASGPLSVVHGDYLWSQVRLLRAAFLKCKCMLWWISRPSPVWAPSEEDDHLHAEPYSKSYHCENGG
jgi:hypothetical protein